MVIFVQTFSFEYYFYYFFQNCLQYKDENSSETAIKLSRVGTLRRSHRWNSVSTKDKYDKFIQIPVSFLMSVS